MSMSSAYTNALADAGAALITHFGLVDETGTELTGGSYARIANTPTSVGDDVAPSTDLTFEVPAGVTVGGWRAYSASTAGTNYGGGNITPNEVYASAGQFVLDSATTAITHTAA